MRSTVGPLPSAVYWRRRAVVLGAVLLGIIVLFVSCSGGGDDDKKKPGSSAGSQFPTPGPASSTPDDEPSLVDVPPGAGNPSLPDPEDLESGAAAATPTGGAIPSGAATGTGTTTGGSDTNVNVPASGDCTAKEVSVTPIPAVTTLKRGAQVEIRLKIKNVSARTCNRDVGADLQELYIQSGAQKLWSSDTCSTIRGTDVRAFPPNGEREYNVTWNGHQSNKCTGELATGPAPAAGQYQIRGRLGEVLSDPVTLTITD
ncbi:adhesin [Winogradskya humida]|uniref:adhesin n=1 Tax=Winogradskya humida TaxID=113566 RepID=UPI0019432DE4|nr:adhesin [Actinoplanes humidus]